MKNFFYVLLVFWVLGLAGPGDLSAQQSESQWNRFRGPNGQGASSSNDRIPSLWKGNQNIAWSSAIKGLGSSSPVVSGGKIFLTSYTGYGLTKNPTGSSENLKRHLVCLDLKTGQPQWTKSVDAKTEDDPYKGFIQEHGYASSSPVTDGKVVVVNFGRAGLYAYDYLGKELWSAYLGNQSDKKQWGLGASPVLVDQTVVVNCGNVDRSIKAFDLKTGKEKWAVKNEEFQNSWSTPIVLEIEGKKQVVFNMPGSIYSLDPATGAENWKTKSPVTGTACASLAAHQSIIYTMGGRAGLAGAIDCSAKSDQTVSEYPSARKNVWDGKLRAGIGTPIVVGDSLLWHSRGILYRANRLDGKLIEKIRLPKPETKPKEVKNNDGKKARPKASYASLVAVGNRVFLTSDLGLVYVYLVGEELELLETNKFEGDNGRFSGTPAIVDDCMIFRAEKRVFCVKKK